MSSEGTACIPGNAVQNLICGSGPDKDFDELANRRLELSDAAKGAASNPLVDEFGEPSFNKVEPRTMRGSEVNWNRGRLMSQLRMIAVFVSAVVIENEMGTQTGSSHPRP
jgi:hypothetical protein